MPAPLSRDLRERIVRAVAGGSSIRYVALRFDVSPSAAVKLMRRFRQSGSPAPARLAVIVDPFSSRMRLPCGLSWIPRPTSH
jgi:transposase-like protein